MKLANIGDLKSPARKGLWVRVPPPALICISAAVAVLCGCSTKAVPRNWKRSDTRCFTFSMPPDMEAQPLEQVETYAGAYRSRTLGLSFEYGWYTDPLEKPHGLDYQETTVEIDKKSAKLVTFVQPDSFATNRAEVYFAQSGTARKTGSVTVSPTLTMRVEGDSPAAQATAKKIFASITFPSAKRKECLGD